jgi:hypothetical protein
VTSAHALLLALLLALAAFAFAPQPAEGQVLTVSDTGVENDFPEGIQFSVSARSDVPIEKVRLRYTVLPDGSAASAVPEFEELTAVSTSLTLGGDDLYLPPGTGIDYFWEVEDRGGNTATTEEKSIVYEDTRFDWQTLESGGVILHYYSGGDEDAQAMADVAHEALAEMSGLLGASVEFPVNVRIYASVDDMRPALQRRSETYESQIITAGVRVSSDTVLVLGNVSFSTLRHELAHVVTAIAGEGPFGALPAWLDEGTAVYAQGDPEGFSGSVERAIQRGNVLSLRSITSYQGDPAKVDLFYGQSWSVVSYLVETYGEEKFAQLFAEIREGNTTDSALEAVYGFDQDGLDNEWRASVGLPPRPDGGTDGEEPVPTFPPSDGGQGDGSAAGDDGDSSSLAVIVGIVLGVLAVAGAIGLATVVLARRFR